MSAEKFVPEDVLLGVSYPFPAEEDVLINSQPIVVVNLKALEERAKETSGFLMNNVPSEEAQARSHPAFLPRRSE